VTDEQEQSAYQHAMQFEPKPSKQERPASVDERWQTLERAVRMGSADGFIRDGLTAIDSLRAKVAQLEAERDAAVEARKSSDEYLVHRVAVLTAHIEKLEAALRGRNI